MTMGDGTKKDDKFPRKTRELLRIIKKADEEDRLYETVIEELQHPVSMPALWACREYIRKLPEEVYRGDGMESYILLSISALIATMEDELDQAKEFLSQLGETPAHIDIRQCTGKDYIRMATEMVMPFVSDNEFFHVAEALTDMNLPVKNLTLSASRPSILNGFRDFTRYGRKIAENRTVLQRTIQTLYGNKSKGVVDIALAEWYYQENDPFHSLVLVTGTIPFMENKRDIQCLFVAMALQMKILLLNGQIKAAEPLVAQIKTQIEKWGWEELMNSLKALTAWAACYDGNMDVVQEWMTGSAPDETKLKTVTVGKNVTKIGKNAFNGCKNLKTLTIRSTKLTKKGLANGSFKGISKKTVIKVPKNKVKAYKKLLQSKGLDKKVKVK